MKDLIYHRLIPGNFQLARLLVFVQSSRSLSEPKKGLSFMLPYVSRPWTSFFTVLTISIFGAKDNRN